MGFFDLFRPNWKHSDKELRLSAVRDLEESQTKALAEVALTDPEANIRKVAIRKLSHPETLRRVAKEDTAEEVRKLATEKLSAIYFAVALSGNEQQKAVEAVTFLVGEKELIELATRAPLEAVRNAALQAITRPKSLVEVIRKTKDRNIQTLALQRIEERTLLKELSSASLPKDLVKEVVKKLEKMQGPAASKTSTQSNGQAGESPSISSLSLEKRMEKREKLCKLLESLSQSNDWDAVFLKVNDIKQSWAVLGDNSEEPKEQVLIERFQRLLQQHSIRKQSFLDRFREEQERESQRQKWLALCEELQHGGEFTSVEELEGIRAKASALGSPKADLKPLETRFLQMYQQAKRRIGAVAASVNKDQSPSWSENSKSDKPRSEKRPSNPEHTSSNLEHAYQTQLSLLEKVCDELERDLDQASRKEIDQRLKTWQETIENLDALPKRKQLEIRARFTKLKEALSKRLVELKEASDWKQWSLRSQLDQLELRLNKLKEETDGRKYLEEVRAIREASKSFAHALKKDNEFQERKTRFLEALSEAKTKAETFKEALLAERLANVPMKEELCQKAEALVASTEWKESVPQMNELRAKWNQVGPLPKEQAQALTKRFREAYQQFFVRYREYLKKQKLVWEQNLKRKESLCTQAEALSESSDFRYTANQFRKLSAEWKEIGAVPKAAAKEINNRFRKAWNHFFERRDSYLKEREAEIKEQSSRKQALYETLEAILKTDDPVPSIYTEIKRIRADWKSIGTLPRSKEGNHSIDEQFDELCRKVIEKHKAKLSVQDKAELDKELSRFSNRLSLPQPTPVET